MAGKGENKKVVGRQAGDKRNKRSSGKKKEESLLKQKRRGYCRETPSFTSATSQCRLAKCSACHTPHHIDDMYRNDGRCAIPLGEDWNSPKCGGKIVLAGLRA